MDLQLLITRVESYTQQNLSRYIEELRELCAIDSGTYHKPGLDEVARYLAVRMCGLGMEGTFIEHETWGNDLLSVIKGNGRGKVLLLGHMDTVYPIGTAATRPLHVENDIIYGPGVCDMKGCILSAIYAIEALLELGYRSFGEIRFLCVSDEETQERHSKDIIQQVCQDCHGALVLEAARENGDIVSARKGNARYTLTARGRSAHAGVEPEKGCNAIKELAHQILQFESLQGWRKGLTISTGSVCGGTSPNVVPDYAQARFDLRFLKTQDKIATEHRWQEMMQQQIVRGVELTLEGDKDYTKPMVCTPENLQLANRAQEIAGRLGFSVNHVLTGGASDASLVSGYGIPTLDGLGPIGGLDHSPDEFLVANSIAPRTALLAGLIVTIGDPVTH